MDWVKVPSRPAPRQWCDPGALTTPTILSFCNIKNMWIQKQTKKRRILDVTGSRLVKWGMHRMYFFKRLHAVSGLPGSGHPLNSALVTERACKRDREERRSLATLERRGRGGESNSSRDRESIFTGEVITNQSSTKYEQKTTQCKKRCREYWSRVDRRASYEEQMWADAMD